MKDFLFIQTSEGLNFIANVSPLLSWQEQLETIQEKSFPEKVITHWWHFEAAEIPAGNSIKKAQH